MPRSLRVGLLWASFPERARWRQWRTSIRRETGNRGGNTIKSSARFIAIYFTVSLFLCGFGLFAGYPWHPITLLGWILFFLLVPPIYLLSEFVGELIFSDRMGDKIESRKISPLISVHRMAYAFFAVLLLLGIILFIQFILENSFSVFFEKNFSNKW